MQYESGGLLQAELGIVAKDGIFFHSPSAFAQQHLFYLMWGADYDCVHPYSVQRAGFDAFLLFFIKDGAMEFAYRGKSFTATAGDVVLLDCNFAHHYWTSQSVRFYWFHFQGASSRAYCDRFWETHGAHFASIIAAEQSFTEMQQLLRQKNADDDLISVSIHRLLALLSMPSKPTRPITDTIRVAQQYIDAHFSQGLTVDDIAKKVSLSRHYFSRLFQEEVGTSPHAYLVEVRIAHAKKLLSETTRSVEQIAIDCAFCSASNFIRTFRKHTGMTPLKFRQLF